MKVTRINVFLLILRLTAILFLVAFVLIVPFLPTENGWVVIPIIGIFIYLLFINIRSMVLDTITIHLNNDTITLTRFFGYQHQVFNKEDILGFSDSEIKLHRWDKKFKSVVIYTKQNQAFELISYNYTNFNTIRNNLKRLNYLGKEPYQTGWMFRKFKFFNKN